MARKGMKDKTHWSHSSWQTPDLPAQLFIWAHYFFLCGLHGEFSACLRYKQCHLHRNQVFIFLVADLVWKLQVARGQQIWLLNAEILDSFGPNVFVLHCISPPLCSGAAAYSTLPQCPCLSVKVKELEKALSISCRARTFLPESLKAKWVLSSSPHTPQGFITKDVHNSQNLRQDTHWWKTISSFSSCQDVQQALLITTWSFLTRRKPVAIFFYSWGDCHLPKASIVPNP